MSETNPTPSGSTESMKKGTMTYGQFMESTHDTENKYPPPYPAFGNPGYDTAGYKLVP